MDAEAMVRKPLFRKRYPKKEAPEPLSLPTSIAWSTIAALILLGTIQELGRFGRPLDTRFGFTFIAVFLAGTIVSVSLFISGRRRSGIGPRAKRVKMQDRVLDGDIEAWWISVISPIENFLVRKRFNPDHITLLSFGFNAAGCILFCVGWVFMAGWAVIFAGTLDVLDGRIARKIGTASKRGAFFDSMLDRYGEILIFLGLAVHLRDSILFPVILLALAGSLMVSYTRARAEGLGATCRVGMMQRPERIVLLGLGAIFSSVLYMLRGILGVNAGPYLMGLVLILIAILANHTAFSRMIHVMRELNKDKEPPP
jgi:CDP-diacylglycerol--glycerol-3-phosphate 3-phosphatidyltransferase